MQVGAVVLRPDRSVASVGYNGAPPGIELEWMDRDERRKFVLHAETNALRYCVRSEVAGGMLAVNYVPCADCIKQIAAYGIRDVVYDLPIDETRYPTVGLADFANHIGVNVRSINASD